MSKDKQPATPEDTSVSVFGNEVIEVVGIEFSCPKCEGLHVIDVDELEPGVNYTEEHPYYRDCDFCGVTLRVAVDE